MRYEDKAVGSSRLGQCIRLGNNMKQRKMLDFWMEVWDLIRGKDAPTPVFDFQEKRRIGSIVIKNTSAGVVSCIPISYALHVRLRSLLDIRVAVVKISSPMHREPIYKLKCKSEVCKCFLYERGVPRINTPPPLSSRSVTTYEGGLIAAPKPLRVPPNLVNPLDDMSQPWTISPTKSKMEPVLATWQFISSDHPACSNARFIRPG